MPVTDIPTRLRRVLHEHAGRRREAYEPQATWVDLGLDSLDLIALVLDCEREFNITISNEAFEGFSTVGDMVNYLEKNDAR